MFAYLTLGDHGGSYVEWCVCVFVSVCMCDCMSMCVSVYLCVYVSVFMSVCWYACLCVCVCVHVPPCVCLCVGDQHCEGTLKWCLLDRWRGPGVVKLSRENSTGIFKVVILFKG